jgi:hypothetical protein
MTSVRSRILIGLAALISALAAGALSPVEARGGFSGGFHRRIVGFHGGGVHRGFVEFQSGFDARLGRFYSRFHRGFIAGLFQGRWRSGWRYGLSATGVRLLLVPFI